MGGFPILSAMTFLPLAGALIIMLVRAATAGSRDASSSDAEGRTALLAGLIISGATFIASLAAFGAFDASQSGYQLVEQYSWYRNISYKMGIDGLSISLILLTTFLIPICLLAS